MPEAYIEETQSKLGAVISSPKLSEKLLLKPPFRFLHDIVTSFIKATGFPEGLYPEDMLDSANVSDKEKKIQFLSLLIAAVESATGSKVSANPSKIVAGHEPDQTNALLQLLASCAALPSDKKAAAVKAAKSAGDATKSSSSKGGDDDEKRKRREEEKKKRKEEEGDGEKKKHKEEDGEKKKHKEEDGEKKKHREEDGEKKKHKEEDSEKKKRKEGEGEEKKKHKEEDGEKKKRKEEEGDGEKKKHRDEDGEKKKHREDDGERKKRKEEEGDGEKKKHKEEDGEKKKRKEEEGDEKKKHREDESERKKRKEEDGEKKKRKEEEGEKKKRKEEDGDGEKKKRRDEDDEERRRRHEERKRQEKKAAEQAQGSAGAEPSEGKGADGTTEGATGQQQLPTRQLIRKSSAGKAPPRSKASHEVVADDGSSANVAEVIRETKRGAAGEGSKEDGEENDWMRVAEQQAARPTKDSDGTLQDGEAKGYLGQQALRAKREQEEETARLAQDGGARGPREGGIIIHSNRAGKSGGTMAEGELSKLRQQLQLLTKASNPLGKLLESIHDDIDTMGRELEMWRSEARSQALAAADARRQTTESLQEVHAQLQALEDAISDQILKNHNIRRNIISNDNAIAGMVRMFVNPDALTR
ncbi:hypothetical protein, conserved [Trypanosoma brucei gambiense DAL972]|uniref:TRAF3-interacting protein 1 n=1 Tax=Trypanosoma brucei gambiense (strain MHOM/CI/86/DAL972) TaxID=679716 RepID=D0A116_TRYB9|nr:hypothetical protein, conserved [Trypanosoma brucei gambiense DAL972]CBH14958.1 hypothetical protein, conserved [Trypanosoma brucei gambiense DAL972]|eukprot:XP_011777224.1 hypothetical protein, conserved [Trypanosoma brucei gambiense DAL972]